MSSFEIYKSYWVPVVLGATVFALCVSGIVFAQAEDTSVFTKSLVGKTASEKADIKGQEIARITKKDVYRRGDIQIEIADVQAISGGVEVFARAWKNGKQIGFGTDGSVDIERFRIYNPPILVPDENGDIVREWTAEDGTQQKRTFREDPQEALLQVLEHDLSVMKNIHGDERIVKGKRGNTTSTFFSTNDDGTLVTDAKATYSAARDATSADSIYQTHGNLISNSFIEGSDYYVRRFATSFDTSAIPDGDTINAATYSLSTETVINSNVPEYADADSVVVGAFGGSNPPTTADFNDFGATSFGTKTIASWATIDGVYNDITFNPTGIATINKTGITLVGARTLNDINNLTPTGKNSVSVYQAEEAGTSKDPKLVVEHTAVSAPIILKARKNSDESVQNSSTLQNDNNLVLTLEANRQYIVDGILFVSAGSILPDLKIAIAPPSGSTLAIGYLNDVSRGVLSGGTTSSNIPLPAGSTKIPVHFSGTVVTGATGGDAVLQWAQNTSNANATTIHTGSFIRAEEI